MNKRGPSGLFLLVQRGLRPVVWTPILSIAALTAVLLTLPDPTIAEAQPSQQPDVSAATKPPEEAAQPTPTPEEGISSDEAPASAVSIAARQPQPVPMYCTTTGFGAPAAINPVAAGVGVTAMTNAPVYYTFRGGAQHSDTVARASACARQQPGLGGSYHGLTAYTIIAAYDTTSNGDNICRIHNVRVTLHQSILLPNADMTGLPAPAVASWNAAAAKLQTHEYEHEATNRSYAQSMYDQLAALSGDCTQVAAQASTVVEGVKASMRTANQSLDARSKHGVQ